MQLHRRAVKTPVIPIRGNCGIPEGRKAAAGVKDAIVEGGGSPLASLASYTFHDFASYANFLRHDREQEACEQKYSYAYHQFPSE